LLAAAICLGPVGCGGGDKKAEIIVDDKPAPKGQKPKGSAGSGGANQPPPPPPLEPLK